MRENYMYAKIDNFNMKKLLILVPFFLIISTVFAQNNTICDTCSPEVCAGCTQESIWDWFVPSEWAIKIMEFLLGMLPQSEKVPEVAVQMAGFTVMALTFWFLANKLETLLMIEIFCINNC
jgi:hypothetical protein